MIGIGKFWIGLGVSSLLLALFLVTIDLGAMVEALADANYLFVVPGIALYLVSVLFRTLRWQALLRHIRPIGVARLYPAVVVGYMANDLLPMRLGELVRSYYVGEREGISKTASLATIVVERVLDALMLLFFIAAISLFAPVGGLARTFGDQTGVAWPLLVVAFSLPFVAAFAMLLLFALYPARSGALAKAAVTPLPERFEIPLRRIIDMLLHGLTPLRSPRTLGTLFALSAPIWILESALFFFVAYSFGLDQLHDSIGELAISMVLVTAISNIASSVPAAPGGTGLFEIVTRETLVYLPTASIGRSVAGSYAIVVHAALLLPMIILGQVFLWNENISLRRLSAAGRAESTVSQREERGAGAATLLTEREDSD